MSDLKALMASPERGHIASPLLIKCGEAYTSPTCNNGLTVHVVSPNAKVIRWEDVFARLASLCLRYGVARLASVDCYPKFCRCGAICSASRSVQGVSLDCDGEDDITALDATSLVNE